jgi:O-antigen ligase
LGFLFGFGIFLTIATALRIPNWPVGPGEILLGIWMIWAMAAVMLKGRPVLTPSICPFLVFWCVLPVVYMVGWVNGLRLGLWDPTSGVHDFGAVMFVCGLILLYGLLPEIESRTLSALLVYLISCLIIMAIIYIFSLLGDGWEASRFWMDNRRFLGLSKNPNQLALGLAVVPFWGMFMARRSRSTLSQIAYVMIIGTALFLGWETKSDALLLSWALAAFVLLALGYWKASTKREMGWWRGVTLKVAVPFGGVFLMVVLALGLYSNLSEIGQYYYSKEMGQGSTRLALWGNGLLVFQEFPLVGIGPGAYGGYMQPFEGVEAHNTLIDLGVSTGILGTSFYVLLLIYLFFHIWRSGNAVLFAGLLALTVFSMFHFVLRHPVYWFFLLTTLILSGVKGGIEEKEKLPALA